MNYILYKIDDITKTIYVVREDDITIDKRLSNITNDYERIVKFANENNYTIKPYEKTENYEDVFSLKRHL